MERLVDEALGARIPHAQQQCRYGSTPAWPNALRQAQMVWSVSAAGSGFSLRSPRSVTARDAAAAQRLLTHGCHWTVVVLGMGGRWSLRLLIPGPARPEQRLEVASTPVCEAVAGPQDVPRLQP